MTFLIIYLIMINLIGFSLMMIDKRKAIKRKRRIPERTLFILSALGGSLGALIAMHVFHHKTRKLRFWVGLPVLLALQLVACIAIYSWMHHQQTRPISVVSRQLSQIQQRDEEVLRTLLSHQSFPILSGEDETVPASEIEAIRLFFAQFKYEILSEQIDGNSAQVITSISNIDTHELAHDLLLNLTERVANPLSENTVLSTADYFSMLSDTLQEKSFGLISTQATFHLSKQNKVWEIDFDEELENALLSGFLSEVNDPYLLSSQEVLAVYMDAFRLLSAADWKQYLKIHDIFSTYSPKYADELDLLYTQKLAEFYSYSIDACQSDKTQATAKLTITSIDMSAVLSDYRQRLLNYAGTTQSITSDSVQLADATAQFLLDAMNDSAAPAEYTVSIHLYHNGETWIPAFNDEVTKAFLGDIQSALEAFR